MNKRKNRVSPLYFPLLTLLLNLSGCSQDQGEGHSTDQALASTIKASQLTSPTQSDIDNIAANLEVKYRLVTNIPSDKCNAKIADGACFEVELSFKAKQAITSKDWSIYFSQITPVQSSEGEEFNVEHLNGDLHRINLGKEFTGFMSGETKKFVFRANFWMLSETDALPNYIVSATGVQARVIKSTQVKIDQYSGLEVLPFVVPFHDELTQFKRTKEDKTTWLNSELLFQRNLAVSKPLPEGEISVAQTIIPTPKLVNYADDNAVVDISRGIKVALNNVASADVEAALARLTRLGLQQTDSGLPLQLALVSDKSKTIGSYQLSVSDQKITITGVDAQGVFNGIQSLASLYSVGSKTLPVLNVEDEPHYTFRGMLVDVARNFHSKEFILSLLEQMAAYKLNKLHLHLGDDEGWRLEIPSLPELTEISSKRCFPHYNEKQEQSCLIPQLGAGVDSSTSVNGFYSVSDYTEILQAASARHIQVIPSLDMPGHSRSSMKAMTARYHKYQALEDEEKAKQFLLDDFDDKTQYSSVQYYNDNTMNVCLESTYNFVTEVMTQVKQIHADAGQPLTRYHIGADETAGAWLESPACKAFVADNDKGVTDMSELGAYFIERVAGILSDLNIETAGWSDGMEHTRKANMPAIVQANAWDVLSWGGHEKVHALANRDWQVVISSPDALYFDFPYEPDPKEHGYYWASRHINTEKIFQFMPDNLPVHAEFWLDRQDNTYVADDTKTPLAAGQKFMGIQGQLWSENTRSDVMVEHKVFPRLLALAERAWHLPQWALPYNYQGAKYSQETQVFNQQLQELRDSRWHAFANTLGQKEFVKLELGDINYRLPTVGAVIKEGKLTANIAFPGLDIEYQDQAKQWQRYSQPVKVEGEVMLRSRSKNGARYSRITQVK